MLVADTGLLSLELLLALFVSTWLVAGDLFQFITLGKVLVLLTSKRKVTHPRAKGT